MNSSPRPIAGLILAIAVYVVLRALILFSNFDETAMPAYELYMFGTLSRQLLGDGGGMPLALYYDNAAGPVFLSYVGALVYWLLGSSYLALKLVAGLFGLGALVLIWVLLKRLCSVRAANLGALLFALAPATLVKYTLFTAGNHSENLFFTLGTFVCFFGMHVAGVTPKRLFATGFVAGFAIFIFLGAITPVGLLALTHWGLRGWKRTGRDLLAGVPGFALGVAPLIAINLALGSRGGSFLLKKFKGGGEGEARDWSLVGARIGEFFTVHLPNSTTYEDLGSLAGSTADRGFLAAFLLAVVLVLPAAVRSIGALVKGAFGGGAEQRPGALADAMFAGFLLYLPLTALAYGLSDLRIGEHGAPMESAGYRYFLPQLTFSIVLMAGLVGRAGAGKLAALPVLVGLALATFNSSLVDWSFEHPNPGAHYDGYNVKQNARALLHDKNGLSDEQIVEYAEGFSPLFRSRVYYGLGFYAAFTAGGQYDLAALSARYPVARHGDIARGVGTFLRHNVAEPGVLLPDRAQLVEGWIVDREPHAQRVVEGLCAKWSVQLANDTELLLDENERLLATSPEALRPMLARGLGVECGRLLRRGLRWEVASIEARMVRIPAAFRVQFAHGVGAGLVDGGERLELEPYAIEFAGTLSRDHLLAGARARANELWGAARAAETVAVLEAVLPAEAD